MKLIHVFTVFGTAESFFDGQFKYMSESGYENILVSSDAPQAKLFAERNNLHFAPIDIPRSMSPKNIFLAIHQLIKLIKQEKPDAVIGHTPVGALVAMIAAFLMRIKNRIYYRHGLIYTTMKGLKHFVFKKEEQFVSILSTHVVNVSHSISRLAVREKLNNSVKQSVIGYGTCGGLDAQFIFNPRLIDMEKLSAIRKKLNLDDADIVFGFCGRICVDKGIPELIDGFELFQKKNSTIKAKLLIIGQYDIRDGVSETQKRQMEANEDIVISGYIRKDKIPYYYSLLDCFVFPSHREGFGMCVLEASAMQIPILVSRAHGCEDSIVEHVTGEYIDLTAESICEGMEMMLDVNLRSTLGNNGRKNVLECYDFPIMWPLIVDMYKRIMK